MTHRLAFIINDGPYFRAHWLARALAAERAGYDVHVISGSAIPGEIPLPVHIVPMDRQGMSPLGNLATRTQLDEQVRALAPDLLHAATVKPNLLAGSIARKRSLPAVLSVTGLGTLFSHHDVMHRLLQRSILTGYRYVARPSMVRLAFENPDDRAMFAEARVAPPGRMVVVPGAGVDTDHFREAPIPSTDPPIVMLATRMLYTKGIEDFIEAAGIARASGLHARWVMVGTPDAGNPGAIPVAELEAWRERGAIEWWGGRSDMPEVLAQARIVTLPTRYREGIPRVLIEAAACGRPLVATDLPGCREICRPGVNGILIPPGNPGALVAAVRELLANPARMAGWGAASRRIAVDGYREALVIARTLALYDEVMAAR